LSVNVFIVSMTMWKPDLSRRTGPLYLAIADAMAAGIEGGELKAGDRLPPQRSLAFDLGLTIGTVTRAYAEAERRGLVAGEVGRGTFVRSTDTKRTSSLLHPAWSNRRDAGPQPELPGDGERACF